MRYVASAVPYNSLTDSTLLKKSRRVHTQQLRISIIDSVEQAVERLMRHIQVCLRDDLKGRVHAQHRYAEVYYVDVHVGDVLRDGTAALSMARISPMNSAEASEVSYLPP